MFGKLKKFVHKTAAKIFPKIEAKKNIKIFNSYLKLQPFDIRDQLRVELSQKFGAKFEPNGDISNISLKDKRALKYFSDVDKQAKISNYYEKLKKKGGDLSQKIIDLRYKEGDLKNISVLDAILQLKRRGLLYYHDEMKEGEKTSKEAIIDTDDINNMDRLIETNQNNDNFVNFLGENLTDEFISALGIPEKKDESNPREGYDITNL